jgi:hypothetical protein
MSLLGESLLQPDVTVVQALLLLCNSLGAQGAAANGPVLYLRIGEKAKDSEDVGVCSLTRLISNLVDSVDVDR